MKEQASCFPLFHAASVTARIHIDAVHFWGMRVKNENNSNNPLVITSSSE